MPSLSISHQKKPDPALFFSLISKMVVIPLLILCMFSLVATGQQKKRTLPSAKPQEISIEETAKLEAVITTDLGVIRFEFFPDKAPKHTLNFIKLARNGFYDGSAFFRLIQYGIIQGGDPLLKNPGTPRERWGTGGLNQLPDEFSDTKHIRGIVSAARIPGRPNSGGAQFFVCSAAQPQLDGQFTAFGMVNEGIEIVDKISLVEVDKNSIAVKPVKIISIKIEPKKEPPFKSATVEQMRKEVLLKTNFGEITIEMLPEIAPEHVRNFLTLVETGWYDGTAFHRLIPGFVIQGGMRLTRTTNKTHPADRWLHLLKGEFSTIPHVRGILSMARGEDPDSAATSFFIVLGTASHLDNKYSVFGKVISGFDTLEKMEKVPLDGETPTQRIEIIEAAIKSL